jgi:hypothetical protein
VSADVGIMVILIGFLNDEGDCRRLSANPENVYVS